MKTKPAQTNIEAAVIGFCRNGATIEEIIGATGLFAQVIKNIIRKYKMTKG